MLTFVDSTALSDANKATDLRGGMSRKDCHESVDTNWTQPRSMLLSYSFRVNATDMKSIKENT